MQDDERKPTTATSPTTAHQIAQGVEGLPISVIVIGLDGAIRYVNGAFQRRTNLERESVLGKALPTLFSLNPHDYEDCLTNLRAKKTWSGRWIAILPNGSSWIQEVQAAPLVNEAEVVHSGMLVVRDLTEEDSLGERLNQTSQVSAVNRLAAGVAHEINNPLSYIVGNVSYLVEEVQKHRDVLGEDTAAEWEDALADLQVGTSRVRDIVHELGVLGKGATDSLGAVDVKPLLESTLALVQNQVRHRATLVREYSEVSHAWASSAHLGQAFFNLLINAVDAIEAGEALKNEIRVVLRPAQDGFLAIEVRDTGAGIPDAVLPHIYEPFYSTKPVGEGTGLGLTVAYRALAEMGGHLTVRTKVGEGSTFIMLVPCCEVGRSPHPRATTPPPVLRAKPANILVIDDEPGVARIVERLLDGHSVVYCSTGQEALSLVGEAHFDVILCDLMMPEMTGPQFFVEMTKKFPHLGERCVFITGGAFTQEASSFLKKVPNKVVEKPFSAAELRELVDQMLCR